MIKQWQHYFVIALLAVGFGLFGALGYAPPPAVLAQQTLTRLGLPPETSQVLWVTSNDWNATAGQLLRLEKQQNRWQVVGEGIPVRLGRKGMAWGLGCTMLAKLPLQP